MSSPNTILRKALTLGGLLLALLVSAVPSVAVTITVGTSSGQVGDTVILPVTITDLTEDVWSFEIDLGWYFVYAQCVGVSTTGTLSDGWSVSLLSESGSVTVAGAAASPMSGDGVMFELLMEMGPNAGSTSVSFGDVVLNEGEPVPTLVNGSLTSTALPTINIAPDSGLMAVGDSLSFSTTGGTAPYTYTSSDPLVAAFTDNYLHALAPGYVQATSEDTGLITNTTTGLIEVRPFRLTVGAVTVTAGQTALIPVTLDDPAGYGIVASEVQLTWYQPYGTFVGIEIAGTIAAAAGWAAPIVVPGSGSVQVTMAGSTPLVGTGVLFYLQIIPSNSFAVNIGNQVFNEIYQALPVSGYLTAIALPTIGLTPNTATLRIGDQVQFNVTGSPTLPVVWSTDDPAVASISATGLLTALGEGSVRVQVIDDVGATAESGLITVCSLGLPPISSSIGASQTVLVPITVDRTLDDLDIYSYEIKVNYSSASVTFVGAVVAGTVTGPWGAPTVNDNGTTVSIYHAGASSLTGCGPALIYLEFLGDPGLASPYSGISLNSVLFNEGVPCARMNTGTPCELVSSVPRVESGLQLWPNHPNPFNPSTTIEYRLDRDGEVELVVFTARGERVRTLVSDWQAAGATHSVVWNGRDDQGRRQSSGVYYTLLRSEGSHALRKMVLLK